MKQPALSLAAAAATAAAAGLAATPALAKPENFFTLKNPEFVVVLGFLLFISVLLYFRIPSLVGGLLDKRAEAIRAELEEAKAVREEAQTLLASFERKQVEVKEQAERIIEHARAEAAEAAEKARADLRASIARRMAAAEEQIASAEAAAVREVRDTAVQVAIAAAREVIGGAMTASKANALIEEAIAAAGKKLH